jgi:hypothetical protein
MSLAVASAKLRKQVIDALLHDLAPTPGRQARGNQVVDPCLDHDDLRSKLDDVVVKPPAHLRRRLSGNAAIDDVPVAAGVGRG